MPLNGFNYELQWSDFQTRQTRPDGEDEDAFISTRMRLSYAHSERDGIYTVITVSVTASVNREASWKVRGTATDALLRHEQGHFDIQALGAREFFNRVSAASAVSPTVLAADIAAIETEINRRVADKNSQYDTATDHSNTTAVQQTWEARLSQLKTSATGTLDQLP